MVWESKVGRFKQRSHTHIFRTFGRRPNSNYCTLMFEYLGEKRENKASLPIESRTTIAENSNASFFLDE